MTLREPRRSTLAVLATAGIALLVAGGAGRAGPPAPDEQASWDGPRGSHPPVGASEPVRVEIAGVEVDARVVRSGLEQDGSIAGPPVETPWLASWYELGPAPGEIGAAVILGHLDAAESGEAVFYDVPRLQAGERIEVTRRDQLVAVFRVDRVRSFPRDDLPVREIFGRVQYPALRLITCGGAYDQETGYTKNVVVFATLVAVDRPGFFGS